MLVTIKLAFSLYLGLITLQVFIELLLYAGHISVKILFGIRISQVR